VIETQIGLDGSTVRFEGNMDLSLPGVSVLDIRVGGWTYEFTAGVPSLGRWAAETVTGIKLTETYSMQGGKLLVGRGTAIGADGAPAPLLAGVWEGRASSLVALHPKSDETADVVNLFSSFDIHEAASNMIKIKVRGGSGATVDREPTVAKRVAGFGLIETFPVTRRTIRMIPSWAGTRVRGGELFRDTSNDVPYFLLAGDSAISVVMPQDGVSVDDVATGLESLSVAWSTPI
jgi:hypothetical protein